MSHTHLRYHQGVEHTQHPTEETNHMSDENTTPADLAWGNLNLTVSVTMRTRV